MLLVSDAKHIFEHEVEYESNYSAVIMLAAAKSDMLLIGVKADIAGIAAIALSKVDADNIQALVNNVVAKMRVSHIDFSLSRHRESFCKLSHQEESFRD